MKYLLISLVLLLSGCEDRYRYKCQDPDKFNHPDCQKPKCLFTQQCPEYMVAPILEKQVNQSQIQQPQPAPTEAAPTK